MAVAVADRADVLRMSYSPSSRIGRATPSSLTESASLSFSDSDRSQLLGTSIEMQPALTLTVPVSLAVKLPSPVAPPPPLLARSVLLQAIMAHARRMHAIDLASGAREMMCLFGLLKHLTFII